MSTIFEKTQEAITQKKKRPQVTVKGTSFIEGFDTIVLDINPGDSVSLIPEKDNPYDPHAVKIVHDESGEYIGHLPKEHCPGFHDEIEHGHQWRGIVDMVFDPVDNKNPGLRLILDQPIPLDDTERELSILVRKYLDVTTWESEKIAIGFVDIVTRINDGDLDNNLTQRIINSSRLLLRGGVDIGLINDNDLDDISADYADLASEDPMTWPIEDIFEGVIPDYVTVGVVEENGNNVLAVVYDKEKSPTTLWEPGEPQSTLIGTILEYVITRISDPLAITDIDFF